MTTTVAVTVTESIVAMTRRFYVDATTGSDDDSGLTDALAWETVAKVNAVTFWPGDWIVLKKGEMWREQLEIRPDGVSGIPITISSYGTGDAPIINGADIIATWADQGSNIWSASVVAEPGCLFFVDADETIHWGNRETALVNVDAEYDYYWSGGTVSVYAASDPDTRYATVEGSQRNYSIRDFTSGVTDYITIDGIECRFAKIAGIRQIFYDTGWVILNNICHHHGRNDESNGHGAYLMGTNITVRGNSLYENGQHGLFIYSNAGAAMDNILIEQNTAYDNWHTNFDMQAFAYPVTNVTMRRNLSYFTNADIPVGTESYYFSGLDNSTKYIDGLDFYNNLARATKGIGIYLDSYLRNVDVLHNTILNGSADAIYINDDITTATMVIRNNILTTTGTEPALYLDNSANKTVNNNCYLTVSGKYATIDATLYTVWATYQGAGYEAAGVNSDPLVVSSTDLHLQSGSPCRNAGADLDVATDYDGVARDDTPDIGAYEYVA